ncbi:MAG: lysozyme inhibitor LprI family protein [Hellea sp.]
MKIFLIALFSLAPVSCFAQEGCDLGEALCAAQGKYEKADAALMETYQSTVGKIERGYYEDYLVSQKSITETLQKAQSAWRLYRDDRLKITRSAQAL